MLIRSRVLILDEATSSVDVSTGLEIRRFLQRHFVDTTAISIMHRLDLTVEYDEVLTMDAGRVTAFDTPANLIENNNIA